MSREHAAALVRRRRMGELSHRDFTEAIHPLIARWAFVLPAADVQLCGLVGFLGTDAARSYLASLNTCNPAIQYIIGEAQKESGAYGAGFRNALNRVYSPYHDAPYGLFKAVLGQGALRWDGESLDGKKIILLSEGGFGDHILFARYFPILKRAANATGFIPEALQTIFCRNYPWIRWVTKEADIPPVSRGHLVTLPFDFPAVTESPVEHDMWPSPYLDPCPVLVKKMRDIIRGHGLNKISVGLCWRGNDSYYLDKLRSMALDALAPLLEIPGVDFFGLVPGAEREVRCVPGLHDLSPFLKTFDDTAAAVACMDLVISVDTAVANLCGAMNVPVWVLLHHPHEWRWDRHGNGSPWYRSVRTFKQDEYSEWEPVVQQVLHALLNETRRAQ